MSTRRTHPGFTLIEMIIYLALFSILIGGAVVAVYSVFESGDRNQTHAMLQEEGNFLAAKINWTLSGAEAISSPAVNATGGVLTLTKFGSSDELEIELSPGGDMTLSVGGNPEVVLNNTNVDISNLTFTREYAGGTNPESMRATFTVSQRAPNGAVLSQEFSTTKFLRR